MKTSAHTGDIPLAVFITDTTPSMFGALNLRLKRFFLLLVVCCIQTTERVCLTSICQRANKHAGDPGSTALPLTENTSETSSPPLLPFPTTLNPLTHDNH